MKGSVVMVNCMGVRQQLYLGGEKRDLEMTNFPTDLFTITSVLSLCF